MEETLGKRIMRHRKHLGLTQEQLAEQLGVTAQAVSKWENDLSCPDITMLPKLSEIFGITTDELLGREDHKVHQAEVVEDDDQRSAGPHLNWADKKGNNWELKWDREKKGALIFAAFVLWVGALTLLSKLLAWDTSFWGLLWPSALLFFGVQGLYPKFSVFCLGCALFGGYSLIANLDIWQVDIAEELIFPIMILLFGIGLLIDALRKPKKPRFKLIHKGDDNKTQSSCTVDGEYFDCSLSFGEETRRIDLPRLSGGEISTSFGDYTVDLSGCEKVSHNCDIEASCSFGELTILVPRRYRVEPDSSTSFGSFDVSGQPDAQPAGIIRLDASVSFGEICVRYI